MTTPAQDAPLVFPSVAFRPLRLLAICVVFTGLVTVAAALLGHPMVGVFFGIGLGLGLVNAHPRAAVGGSPLPPKLIR